MTEKKFTVKEMQTWNKRYRLDKEDTTKVIDTTMEDAEFWTVHGNEAYNLCIELNELYSENQELKEVLGAILREVKRDITNTNQTGEITVFINPNSYNKISEILRKYGALKSWYGYD